jgi:hypothetical protein
MSDIYQIRSAPLSRHKTDSFSFIFPFFLSPSSLSSFPPLVHNFSLLPVFLFKHNRSLKVAVQGLDFMAHPLYVHVLISSIFLTFLLPFFSVFRPFFLIYSCLPFFCIYFSFIFSLFSSFLLFFFPLFIPPFLPSILLSSSPFFPFSFFFSFCVPSF